MTLQELEALSDGELDAVLAEALYREDDRGRRARDGFIWWFSGDLGEWPCRIRPGDWEQIEPIPAYSSTWAGMGRLLERLAEFGFEVEMVYHRPIWRVRVAWEDEAKAAALPRALALAAAPSFDAGPPSAMSYV